MKSVFCKKLAAFLCMNPTSSQSLEPPVVHTKSRRVATGDNCNNSRPTIDNGNTTASDATTENDSAKELLKEIRDILKARVRGGEEQRFEDQKKNEKKKDWLLAAAILDRICAIAFTVIFVAGTLIFVIVVVARDRERS